MNVSQWSTSRSSACDILGRAPPKRMANYQGADLKIYKASSAVRTTLLKEASPNVGCKEVVIQGRKSFDEVRSGSSVACHRQYSCLQCRRSQTGVHEFMMR